MAELREIRGQPLNQSHFRCPRRDSNSTQADYRSVLDAHLLPEFAPKRIETITTEQIEHWRSSLAKDEVRTRRTVNKIVTQLHSVLEHAVGHHGLVVNSAAKVKRLRESYDAARFDFYSPEEIEKLTASAAAGAHRDPSRPAVRDTVRALRAAEDRQDAAIYLTAALSGLRRGELLALRWEDVDFEQSSIRVFEGYSAKQPGKPKSRKSRTVPMVDKVATALGELKDRSAHTAKADLVFVSREGTHVDGSALRRRYHATLKAAGAFTTCATPSARWPSTSPASSRCRHGWDTPTSRRRCATCTTRAAPTTPSCSQRLSEPKRPSPPPSVRQPRRGAVRHSARTRALFRRERLIFAVGRAGAVFGDEAVVVESARLKTRDGLADF